MNVSLRTCQRAIVRIEIPGCGYNIPLCSWNGERRLGCFLGKFCLHDFSFACASENHLGWHCALQRTGFHRAHHRKRWLLCVLPAHHETARQRRCYKGHQGVSGCKIILASPQILDNLQWAHRKFCATFCRLHIWGLCCLECTSVGCNSVIVDTLTLHSIQLLVPSRNKCLYWTRLLCFQFQHRPDHISSKIKKNFGCK